MPRSRGAFFLIEWLGQSALVATDWWTRKGIADRLGRLEYLEHELPRPPDRHDISRPPFAVLRPLSSTTAHDRPRPVALLEGREDRRPALKSDPILSRLSPVLSFGS